MRQHDANRDLCCLVSICKWHSTQIMLARSSYDSPMILLVIAYDPYWPHK